MTDADDSRKPLRLLAATWQRQVQPLLALAALTSALAGCGGANPAGPETTPASGGQRFVLDYVQFQQIVEPVLQRQGCDAVGDCHGGGIRGTFQLSSASAKDPSFDFEQAALQVTGADPDASPLLLQPLAEAAGGEPHPITAFASADDPDFRLIRAWILEGSFQ